MKQASFLFVSLLCLVVFSLACSAKTSYTAPDPTGSIALSATATPTPTQNQKPLSLLWTEPSKNIVAKAGSELFFNFRGEGTDDSSATIRVGVDTDMNEGNGLVRWFDRTYKGGDFLVTLSASDLPAGSYYFVAKITRAGETITRYLDKSFSLIADTSVSITSPQDDTLAAWHSNFAFEGTNGSASSNVRIFLDSDKNPTNGFFSVISSVPNSGAFQQFWTVGAEFNGRYFVCINVHDVGQEVFSYAPGSLLIGDNPSVTFTSPMNDLTVHPAPTSQVNISGTAISTAGSATFRIGYDTDLNPRNGGITWLFTGLDMGAFNIPWDIDISTGGTYYIVSEVTDSYGTAHNYAPGRVIVDGRTYLEIHDPVSDITIVAGEFYPLFIKGYGYSTAGNGNIVVFYDTDNNLANGFVNIETISEGPINSLFDVSVLSPGIYHVGAMLQSGLTTLETVWSPMTMTVTPNPDISTPVNSGSYYITSKYKSVYDEEDDKTVRFRMYYPSDGFGSNDIYPGAAFPIVVFIPDQSVSYKDYTYITERFARWGYMVAAVNTAYNSGTGSSAARKDSVDARYILDWLTAQNNDTESEFYDSLDTVNVAVGGHGRGGGAAIISSHLDDRFTAVYGYGSVQNWYYKDKRWYRYKAQAPIFLMGSSASILNPISVQQGLYDRADSFAELATLVGGNNVQYKNTVNFWESDGDPTMTLQEQHFRVQAMSVAFLNAYLKSQSYFMSWVNGVGVEDLGDITVQYK